MWEPAGGENNSGRYWQLFNSNANENANLIGFYQGKPSRLVGAAGLGPNVDIYPEDKVNKEKNDAEITVGVDQEWPLDSWLSHKRYQWVVFISTKKDLLPVEKTQPIGREMNKVSELGAVIQKYANDPVVIVPAFYKGAIYMPAERVAVLIEKVKKDKGAYEKICTIDPSYKALWDAWRFPDSGRSLIKQLIQFRDELITQYADGEGSYTNRYRYWKGGLNYKYYAIVVSSLFADASIKMAPDEKKKLEQLVGLMAKVSWDDNNVPLFDSAGVNFGPANMAFQYRNNARVFFALLLAKDPVFSKRAKQAAELVNKDINESVYENGASFGSPHYTAATIDPILYSILQLKQAGVADFFKTNKRIEKFARFYTSLITPPSCRFAGNRKVISFGDGSEESSATFALLATGLEDVNKALSDQLLSVYYYGPPRFSLAGPTPLAIDLFKTPEKKFTTTSCNYTGYMSHMRSGINTTSETALWLLNGDALYDHRNDDAGEVAIYALQAPVSLSWSSFYYPHASDGRIKSVVIPEKLFPEWDKDKQPIEERSLTNRTWPQSELQEFANLGYSTTSIVRMKKDGKEWYRKATMISLQPEKPIIIFYDSVNNKDANIWSMLMMSEGTVITPVGEITPAQRIYNNKDRNELPGAMPVKTLRPGLQRFIFNGQNWVTHPSKGINWHLYNCSDDAVDFTLSSWGNTWESSVEQNEFLKTNGYNYREEQQIIRLRSSKPFFNVLLPYNKGTNPYNNNVKKLAGNNIMIQKENETIEITPDYFYAKQSKGVIIGVVSSKRQFRKEGISVTGGFTEIEYSASTVKIRVHGNAGKRTIILPFAISMIKNDKNVLVNNSDHSVTIDFKMQNKDVENGNNGFQEYMFERK